MSIQANSEDRFHAVLTVECLRRHTKLWRCVKSLRGTFVNHRIFQGLDSPPPPSLQALVSKALPSALWGSPAESPGTRAQGKDSWNPKRDSEIGCAENIDQPLSPQLSLPHFLFGLGLLKALLHCREGVGLRYDTVHPLIFKME